MTTVTIKQQHATSASNVLNNVLNLDRLTGISLHPSLTDLLTDDDRLLVKQVFRDTGIVGCKAKFLPTICQRSLDGRTMAFPIITVTQKSQRLEHSQAKALADLLDAGYHEEIAFPTFFYQTGAAMTITVIPRHLACLILSFALEEQDRRNAQTH